MRDAWYLGAVALIAAACGGSAGDAPPDATLRIVARDFAFEAPDTLPAGPARLTFINEGREYHHAQLLRVAADIPFAAIPDSLPASGALPAWLIPVGGAEGADSLARPVTVLLSLTPGRYFLICRITTAAGEVHYALCMHRPLVVVDGGARGVRSPADTAIVARDYAFAAPDTLVEGPWRIRIRNEGPQEHHAAVARLAAGHTLNDVVMQPAGASPVFEVLGGTAGLAVGEENVLELDLPPGQYVYMCFVFDLASKREHYQMGMARLLTVVPRK